MTIFAIILAAFYAFSALAQSYYAAGPYKDRKGPGILAFRVVLNGLFVFLVVAIFLSEEPSWFAKVLLVDISFGIAISLVRLAGIWRRFGPFYYTVSALVSAQLSAGIVYFYLIS